MLIKDLKIRLDEHTELASMAAMEPQSALNSELAALEDDMLKKEREMVAQHETAAKDCKKHEKDGTIQDKEGEDEKEQEQEDGSEAEVEDTMLQIMEVEEDDAEERETGGILSRARAVMAQNGRKARRPTNLATMTYPRKTYSRATVARSQKKYRLTDQTGSYKLSVLQDVA